MLEFKLMRTWFRVALLLVLPCGSLTAQVAIPVVHTWGDLQKATKLTVVPFKPGEKKGIKPPAPVTFQVGIESNEAGSYGGLLLYFISPKTADAGNTPEERGLYSLEVYSKEPLRCAQYAVERFSPEDMTTSGTTFYAETLKFGAVGDYVVRLVQPFDSGHDEKTKVLAQVSVQVRDRPQELWFPWWDYENNSTDSEPQSDSRPAEVYAIEDVVNPQGGAAVPKAPLPRSYSKLPAPSQRLPVLVSNPADHPHVHLKMTDSTLIVTFNQEIEGYFPDDQFLTRWWVNDKRVNLDPKLSPPGKIRSLAAAEWFTKEVHFELHFQPERLGLKKGDRVGVQLLFCPDRWETTSGELMAALAEQAAKNVPPIPTSFSETSNRIEFTYSGDPKHPQK